MDTIKTLAVALIAALAVGAVVLMAQPEQAAVGGVPGVNLIPIQGAENTISVAQTGATSTVTLQSFQSGSTVYVSATGTTITLPAVSDGATFRFVVAGAIGIADMIIDSAEGDNIEGALIVAGAVVDCDAEDQINIINDGENLGDFVELRSNGSKWFITQSGALTTAKMTCTDPN